MPGWYGSLINAPYGAYFDHGYAKILHTHFLLIFVAKLKIDAIYVFYLESFCDKNLALRKVFVFSDSAPLAGPQNMKNNNPSAFFFLLREIALRTHERNTVCQNRKIVYGEYFQGSCLTHWRNICLVFVNVFVIILGMACLTFL